MAEQTMVERVALAIGRVVTRGEVEPKKGWLEAARAAIEAIDLDAKIKAAWQEGYECACENYLVP